MAASQVVCVCSNSQLLILRNWFKRKLGNGQKNYPWGMECLGVTLLEFFCQPFPPSSDGSKDGTKVKLTCSQCSLCPSSAGGARYPGRNANPGLNCMRSVGGQGRARSADLAKSETVKAAESAHRPPSQRTSWFIPVGVGRTGWMQSSLD